MTTYDYQAPGLTVTNIEDFVAQMRYDAADYSSATAGQKAIISRTTGRPSP